MSNENERVNKLKKTKMDLYKKHIKRWLFLFVTKILKPLVISVIKTFTVRWIIEQITSLFS